MILDYRQPEGRAAYESKAPGIYANVPFRRYLSHPGISRSALLTMLQKTPAHYRWEQDHADDAVSEAFLWGSAVHCCLQEPEEFAARYRPGPVNPKTGSEFGVQTQAWADAEDEAQAAGYTLYREAWGVRDMAEAVKAHPDTRRILEGRPLIEATVIWQDEGSGLLCKARPDNLRIDLGIFLDVKTTESAHPGKFADSAAKYGYFDQVAHYEAGLRAILGRDFNAWLIAVEKAPPHCVGCYRVGEAEVEEGRRRVAWALGRIAACEKSGEWPGYREADLYAPKWWHDQLESLKARSAGAKVAAETAEPFWMGGSDDEPDFGR